MHQAALNIVRVRAPAKSGGLGSRESRPAASNIFGMQAIIDGTAHEEPASMSVNHAEMQTVGSGSLLSVADIGPCVHDEGRIVYLNP